MTAFEIIVQPLEIKIARLAVDAMRAEVPSALALSFEKSACFVPAFKLISFLISRLRGKALINYLVGV